jgi:hypothetical protein
VTLEGHTAGNGAGGRAPVLERPADRPSRPAGPTARPAAVVLAVIVVVFLAGFVADLLSSSHHGAAPSPSRGTAPVPGTGGLVAIPAAAVLAPITTADDPPPDILSALVVPEGTRDVAGSASQRGLGLYDASQGLVVPASEGDVITFLRTELGAGRWQITSAAPASGGTYRIIAQHPGSDGYQWELGATLSATTFASPVAGMPVPKSGVTPLTLRLFAISDAA